MDPLEKVRNVAKKDFDARLRTRSWTLQKRLRRRRDCQSENPHLPNRDIHFQVRCRNRLHRMTLTPRGELIAHDHKDNEALDVFGNLNGDKNRCREVIESFRYGIDLHQALRDFAWQRVPLRLQRRETDDNYNDQITTHWWRKKLSSPDQQVRRRYREYAIGLALTSIIRQCRYDQHLIDAIKGPLGADSIDIKTRYRRTPLELVDFCPPNLNISVSSGDEKNYSHASSSHVFLFGRRNKQNHMHFFSLGTHPLRGKPSYDSPHHESHGWGDTHVYLSCQWMPNAYLGGHRYAYDARGRRYAVLTLSNNDKTPAVPAQVLAFSVDVYYDYDGDNNVNNWAADTPLYRTYAAEPPDLADRLRTIPAVAISYSAMAVDVLLDPHTDRILSKLGVDREYRYDNLVGNAVLDRVIMEV